MTGSELQGPWFLYNPFIGELVAQKGSLSQFLAEVSRSQKPLMAFILSASLSPDASEWL